MIAGKASVAAVPPSRAGMHPEKSNSVLTSGSLLARNSIWNLLGQLLPLTVALVAIPPLVHGLGVERFGLLSLAWIVVGYFSFFDLGMGRALTKLVADRLAAKEQSSIPPLVWTSLMLMLALGIAGGAIIWGIAPWVVGRALKVPAALGQESVLSFSVLATSVPIVTVTAGLRGVLEAQQRFRILNLIRIPSSMFFFVGPLLVLPFSHSLVPVMMVLVAGRLLAGVAHLLACLHAMPHLHHGFRLQRSLINPVIEFGSWMTVSNVIGPLMVYLDRFLVGILLSIGAVAYYTAPFDMVNRLWVIPGALAGVLFPAFAVSLAEDRERVGLLLNRGNKYVFLVVFPIILSIVTLAPEGLRFWLGPAFAQNSSSVLRWLAVGVFINCLAHVPMALIHSAGRPDITAKLHLAELPLYLVAVWVLTKKMGIEGTAIAWVGRVAIDAFLIWVFANRLAPRKSRFLPKMSAVAFAALLLFFLGTLPHGFAPKMWLLALALLAFGVAAWSWGLGSAERVYLWKVRAES